MSILVHIGRILTWIFPDEPGITTQKSGGFGYPQVVDETTKSSPADVQFELTKSLDVAASISLKGVVTDNPHCGDV